MLLFDEELSEKFVWFNNNKKNVVDCYDDVIEDSEISNKKILTESLGKSDKKI